MTQAAGRSLRRAGIPMAEKETLFQRERHVAVSRRALTIAHIIDCLCQRPGKYQIRVRVPDHRRRPWIIESYQVDRLRSLKLTG